MQTRIDAMACCALVPRLTVSIRLTLALKGGSFSVSRPSTGRQKHAQRTGPAKRVLSINQCILASNVLLVLYIPDSILSGRERKVISGRHGTVVLSHQTVTYPSFAVSVPRSGDPPQVIGGGSAAVTMPVQGVLDVTSNR